MGIFDFNGGKPPNPPTTAALAELAEKRRQAEAYARRLYAEQPGNIGQQNAAGNIGGALSGASALQAIHLNSDQNLRDVMQLVGPDYARNLTQLSVLGQQGQTSTQAYRERMKADRLKQLNETNGYMVAPLDVCVDLMIARLGTQWFATEDLTTEERMAVHRLAGALRAEQTTDGYARIIPNKE